MSLQQAEQQVPLLNSDALEILNQMLNLYPEERKLSRAFSSLDYSVIRFDSAFYLLDRNIAGAGVFGKIKKAYPLKRTKGQWIVTSQIRAVKIIPIQDEFYREHLFEVQTEFEVVKLYHDSRGLFIRTNASKVNKAYIEMPYFQGFDIKFLGNICDFSFLEKLTICLQVANELKRLHDLNYVHFDIKPKHILYVQGDIKIVDFGLASFDTQEKKRGHVGTPGYVAPELENNLGSSLSDIYSLGICLREFLSPKIYDYESSSMLAFRLRVGNFIDSMTAIDKNDRPSIATIISQFEQFFSEEKELQNSYQAKIKMELTIFDKGLCKIIELFETKITDNTLTLTQMQAVTKLKEQYKLLQIDIAEKMNGSQLSFIKDFQVLKEKALTLLDQKNLIDSFNENIPPLKRYINKSSKSFSFFVGDKQDARFGLLRPKTTDFIQQIEDEINEATNSILSL